MRYWGKHYYADLLEVGQALVQAHSLQTGRASSGRKNGLMKMVGLLQATPRAPAGRRPPARGRAGGCAPRSGGAECGDGRRAATDE